MRHSVYKTLIFFTLISLLASSFSGIASAAAKTTTPSSGSGSLTAVAQPINDSQSATSAVESELGTKSYAITAAASSIPDYNFVKTKPDEAPFSINASQEGISTLSGSLSQRIVDASLPGRNGLGFSLVREYSSDDAQFNQMGVAGGANATVAPPEEKLFPLGKGWSWDLSYIQLSGSDKYLHLAGAGVYKIGSDNSLIGYVWKDLTFGPDTSMTVDGSTSAFVLKSLQKINQYYNADGRLIAIADSFNNQTTFTYATDSLYGTVLSKVTDAIGNTMTISYSAASVVITSGHQTVTYTKIARNGKDLLSQVIDPLGRITTYDYDLREAKFNLVGTTPSTSNPYALLTGITYPTGAKTVYAYESAPVTRYIDKNSVNQVFRIASRQDQFMKSGGTAEIDNRKDITYPSGDMGSSFDTDITYTVAVQSGATQTVYTNEKDYIDDKNAPMFYNTKSIASVAKGGVTYSDEVDYTYDRVRKIASPLTTTETRSQSNTAATEVETSSQTFNDFGETIISVNAMGVQTTYSYDPNSHLLIGLLEPLNDTQSKYTEYVRDPSHGQITAVRIRDGGSTGTIVQELKYSSFDSYGNATQMKILKETGVYTTVDIAYQPAAPYYGAFPTRTSVLTHSIDGGAATVVKQYGYDATNGNLLGYTDGNGNTTSYTYDLMNRVTSALQPDNSRISIYYNDVLNQIQQTDETGISTIAKWNPLGRKTEEGSVEGGGYQPHLRYSYDAQGRLVRTEDAFGRQTQYDYDQWDRQNKVTYPDGTVATATYDDLQLIVKSVDAEGYAVTNYNDKAGRTLVSQETKKVNGVSQTHTLATYTYNDAGNVATQTDGDSNAPATAFEYNVLGQLTSVTNALHETTTYRYDASGNLVTTVYPDASTASKTYDEAGNVIATRDQSSRQEKFYFDANGNTIGMVDRKGNRFKLTYDNRNFLKKKEIVDGAGLPVPGEEVISFAYDLAGRRTQMTDGTGTTAYRYNATNGALLQVTFPDQKTINYAYDVLGNRTSMRDPFGYNTFYKYDSKNRLANVASSLDFVHDSEAQYSYYGNDLVSQIKQKNGVVTAYAYTGLQPETITEKTSDGQVINTFGYTYDNRLNIQAKTENGTGSSFGYDNLNRIQTSSQFNEAYSYDTRGNRTGMMSDQAFESPGTDYQYDKRDRLTNVTTDNGGNVSYRYNGDGLLWERTENGRTTRYYWDGDQVIDEAAVVGGTPQFQARYVRGNGLIARQDGQGEAYYLANGHGDIVELRDSTGKTRLNRYAYDTFGNIVSEQETISQPFKYSGEMTDSTTKLQYLRARWYDPSVGRFINEDTYEGQIDNPLTLNLYTYVTNNPLIYTDPTGMCGFRSWGDAGDCFVKAGKATVHAIKVTAKTVWYVANEAALAYPPAAGGEFLIVKGVGYAWNGVKWVKAAITGGEVVEGTVSAGNFANRVTNLLAKMPEFTGSTREKLLSAVQNSDLRNAVSELYRPGAKVGDGGTASILTKEFYEGSSTHLQKAQDQLRGLNKLAKSGKLSLNDLDILDALADDLENAIRLFK